MDGLGFFGGLLSGLLPGTSGVDRLTAALTAMFATVSDVRFWRSLGWLIIGVVMFGLGLFWLMATPAASAGRWLTEV